MLDEARGQSSIVKPGFMVSKALGHVYGGFVYKQPNVTRRFGVPRERYLKLEKKSNTVLELSWYQVANAKASAKEYCLKDHLAAARAAAAGQEEENVNIGCQVPVNAVLMGSMLLDRSSFIFDEGYGDGDGGGGKIQIQGVHRRCVFQILTTMPSLSEAVRNMQDERCRQWHAAWAHVVRVSLINLRRGWQLQHVVSSMVGAPLRQTSMERIESALQEAMSLQVSCSLNYILFCLYISTYMLTFSLVLLFFFSFFYKKLFLFYRISRRFGR